MDAVEGFFSTCRQIESHGAKFVSTLSDPGTSQMTRASLEKGLELFAELKSAQRALNAFTRELRSRSQEAKSTVDRMDLQLQNLNYEKTHILNDINLCRNFNYLFERVELCEISEFHSMAAPELVAAATDDHQMMLSRLSHERNERKRLMDQLKELQARKQQLLLQNKERQQQIDSIPSVFEPIRKSVLAVMGKLQVPESVSSISMHPLALLLAPPLYGFYLKLVGFQSRQLLNYRVNVVGDAQEARALLTKVNETQSHASADMDVDHRSREENMEGLNGEDDTSNQNKLYQRHPIVLELIMQEGSIEYPAIQFSYLMHLQIATATTANTFNITELFPGDVGLVSPNPANLFMEDNDFSFDAVLGCGRPYHWIQRLCGLNYPPPTSIQSPLRLFVEEKNLTEQVQIILQKLLARAKAQRLLKVQLDSLSLAPPLPPITTTDVKLFPSSETQVALQEWKEQAAEDNTTQWRSFLSTWQHNQSSAVVSVRVPVDYPSVPPIFSFLQATIGERDLMTEFSQGIQDVENELNIHWGELLIEGQEDRLLLLQMRRLAMCLDILLSDNLSRNFVYDSGSGQFVSRTI